MDKVKPSDEICSVCGGFKMKCDAFGHIKMERDKPYGKQVNPGLRPKKDDIPTKPEEEPGYGHGV